MTYRRYESGAGLTYSFRPISPDMGRGLIGLPPDSTEVHYGGEFLYGSDQLAFSFKWRGDGRFLWAGTMVLETMAPPSARPPYSRR